MPDTQLDRFLESPSFLSDLPKMARLPAPVYSALAELLSSVDPTRSDDQADEISVIAAETAADPSIVMGLWYLSDALASSFASGSLTADEAKKRFLAAIPPDSASAQDFFSYLNRLASIAPRIVDTRERRRVINGGAKTIQSVSTTCDLRVRLKGARPRNSAAVDSYKPEVIELIPVTTVRISFRFGDDGDDCVFQLAKHEVAQFIAELKSAEKDLDAAMARVSLRPISP